MNEAQQYVKPHLSVIIAVYNSERALPALFEAGDAAGAGTDFPWELILVDNNSHDKSPDLMRAFAVRSKVPTTVLHERRQGVSYARNTGLTAARGRILAVVDSDCALAPDWPKAVVREFEQDPTLGMVGGRVELYSPNDLPITIRTSRERKAITIEEFNFLELLGCNIAFRREVIDEIGAYDVRLGPGSRIGGGEDVDIVYRAVKAGRKVSYSPDMVVYHNHGRSTLAQYRKTQKTYAVGRTVFLAKYLLRGHRNFARRIYWELVAILRSARTAEAADDRSIGRFQLLNAMLRGFYLQITDEFPRLLEKSASRRAKTVAVESL